MANPAQSEDEGAWGARCPAPAHRQMSFTAGMISSPYLCLSARSTVPTSIPNLLRAIHNLKGTSKYPWPTVTHLLLMRWQTT